VHPIERLRAVARAQGVDQRLLAGEAAVVLGTLADDPLGLVTSCRRLLDRQPGAGALWWACARLLDAADARAEARAIRHDLDDDALLHTLALDLPERASVVVIPDPVGGSALVDGLASRRDDLVPVEAADPAIDVAAVIEAGAGLGDLTGGAPGELVDVDVSRGSGVPGTGPTLVVVEAGAAGPSGFLTVAGAAEGVAAARSAGVPVWAVVGVGVRLPGPLFGAAARRAATCEVLPGGAVERVVEPRSLPCPCPAELLGT
jgi:hypothetical protein